MPVATTTSPMPREAILAAVRAALGDVAQTAVVAPAAGSPLSVAPVERARLLAGFTAEARAVGTVVHAASSADDAGRTLATILADVAAARVVVWPTPLARRVAHTAAPAGVEVLVAAPGTAVDAVAQADVGVTEADALIAASGTLVLRAASGARTVSLLPPLHVAVVPSARIVPDLATALRAARGSAGAPDTCLTLISGPSRTADIEKKLVVGVHGPCALHVILVDDAEG